MEILINIHSKSIYMVKHVASIILYNDEKQVLIQHRTADAPTYPNKYGLFGGRVEKDETPIEAVKRECYEELEYNLENPKLVLHDTFDDKFEKVTKDVFIEKYDPTKKLVMHEGQGMAWINNNNLNSYDVLDHDLEILKEIFNLI